MSEEVKPKEEAKKQSGIQASLHFSVKGGVAAMTNSLLLGVSMLLLAGVAYATWRYLQPSYYEMDLRAVQAQKEATESSAVTSRPELKLNQENIRQGPIVAPNPDSLGKDDPFN